MKTVLVAYASRMGSTHEIAAVIGDQLTGRGFNVHVVVAAAAPNARIVDAVVLGSALYSESSSVRRHYGGEDDLDSSYASNAKPSPGLADRPRRRWYARDDLSVAPFVVRTGVS